MEQEKKFEKIRIDLRPFGWGIRDVDVVWPEGHDCKCEDGPDAGQGGGMDEDDEDDQNNGGSGEFNQPVTVEEEEEAGSDTNADDGSGDV